MYNAIQDNKSRWMSLKTDLIWDFISTQSVKIWWAQVEENISFLVYKGSEGIS